MEGLVIYLLAALTSTPELRQAVGLIGVIGGIVCALGIVLTGLLLEMEARNFKAKRETQNRTKSDKEAK